MMDTHEVAAYLRLKERRVYDLVRSNALPHVRATGKLLFPRAQIDAWLAAKSGTAIGGAATTVPPIVAGSHDPLLEWAVRESGSGLAVLACGSRAGLDRFAEHAAVVAALHWLDRASGEYNVPLVRARLPGADVVVIEWARRVQGLVVAAGNPLRLRTLADLERAKARVIGRQPAAGSHQLLTHLLEQAAIARGDLRWTARPALAETDVAAAVHDGRADAGLAIEAAARAHGLGFVALASERMDLVVRRRDYFEPGVQALLAFARSSEMREHAAALRGYDVGETGRVVFNA
ncbi:MAG: helix-turn-helix transcriptional regulator [Burkholderiales bacterium]|nr:helix-turn-helix transcriptional regulator [Burkholderiales bacterium]